MNCEHFDEHFVNTFVNTFLREVNTLNTLQVYNSFFVKNIKFTSIYSAWVSVYVLKPSKCSPTVSKCAQKCSHTMNLNPKSRVASLFRLICLAVDQNE